MIISAEQSVVVGLGGTFLSGRVPFAHIVPSAQVDPSAQFQVGQMVGSTAMGFRVPALLAPLVARVLLPAPAALQAHFLPTAAAACAWLAPLTRTALQATPAVSTL